MELTDAPVWFSPTKFVSEGPVNIPLRELPDMDEKPIEIPELHDLDALFDKPVKKEIPSLSNLDDLF